MKLMFYILCILTITKSCYYVDNKFITKFGNANFDEFRNYRIYEPTTPGFGRTAPVFFLEELQNPLEIRYVIKLNLDRTEVTKIQKVFIRDTSKTDGVINAKKHFEEMALKFNRLNIYSIQVDSRNNVIVKQRPLEHDKKIARFEHSTLIDSRTWDNIKDNWYQEK